MTNRLLRMGQGLGYCVVVAIFCFGSSAKADSLKLTGTTSNITLKISDADSNINVNAVIDPYKATFTTTAGASSVLIWCVDPDHTVNIGALWNVNVSQLGGDLSKTYLGNANAKTYGEMAWLILQLQGTSASNVFARQELQAAIWNLADQGSDFVVTAPTGDTNFTANVNKDITNAAANALTSGFEILTDTLSQKQEFMVITTPEPSTLLLLGIGLMGLFVLGTKRTAERPS